MDPVTADRTRALCSLCRLQKCVHSWERPGTILKTAVTTPNSETPATSARHLCTSDCVFFFLSAFGIIYGNFPVYCGTVWARQPDRKSTRLNSSHLVISY